MRVAGRGAERRYRFLLRIPGEVVESLLSEVSSFTGFLKYNA